MLPHHNEGFSYLVKVARIVKFRKQYLSYDWIRAYGMGRREGGGKTT
jgi:hypothetical protein